MGVANPGAERLLVGIQFEGHEGLSDPLSRPWPMALRGGDDEDSVVGFVSSAAYSPRVGTPIGLCSIKIEHADVGTRLWVRTPNGEDRGAVVAPLPRYLVAPPQGLSSIILKPGVGVYIYNIWLC